MSLTAVHDLATTRADHGGTSRGASAFYGTPNARQRKASLTLNKGSR